MEMGKTDVRWRYAKQFEIVKCFFSPISDLLSMKMNYRLVKKTEVFICWTQ